MLTQHGHAIARPGSANKVPPVTQLAIEDVLDSDYSPHVSEYDCFVHLAGVARPSPSKAAEFRPIDLPALANTVKAAQRANISLSSSSGSLILLPQ
jgi:nucleoside-diphosphate-sugar epimerase